MHKKYIFIFSTMFIFFYFTNAYTQEVENKKIQIVETEYDIKGQTKEFMLANIIPIDKTRIFNSEEEFKNYIEILNKKFTNQRILQSHSIDTEFLPEENGITPVKLLIHTKDTWNIIALPYPKFDSNTGFQLKLKIKDYNFLGFLYPFNADLIYQKNENNLSSFSFGTNFGIPFRKEPIDFLWDISSNIKFTENRKPEFNLNTGLDIAYKYKIVTFHTGVTQGFRLYPDSENKNMLYYFTDTIYFYSPIQIYKFKDNSSLVWTPKVSVSGNWKFKRHVEDKYRGVNLDWSQNFGIANINWKNNFRQGYSASLTNEYSYNTFKKGNVDISFGTQATGFYSFFDRFGIYGKFDFFYNLNNVKTRRAGGNLRGILDRRIETDTAFTFNFDLPVRIGTFKFDEITGINWTRFLSFELQIVPFLDIALTHDEKTSTYFNPKYGWYSGGLEFLFFPLKMRSICVRASIGWNLTEIKNIKENGVAKRDGESVIEIFIGIGLHY